MKKILLLLTLSPVCIMSHAQKVDRSLLIGRWELYSMHTPEGAMHRDSLRQYIAAGMEVEKRNSFTTLTPEDSLTAVLSKEASLSPIFRTVYIFDKEGHFTRFLPMGGQLVEDKLMYKWRGKNKLKWKIGKFRHIQFIIELTQTKLVLADTDKTRGKYNEMSFTRAK